MTSFPSAEETGRDAVLCTATNVPLACIETIVHINARDLPLNRYLVRSDIPDGVRAKARRLDAISAHVDRDALPADKGRPGIGDVWLAEAESALSSVPSALVPEDHNVLIDPGHPDPAQINVTAVRRRH